MKIFLKIIFIIVIVSQTIKCHQSVVDESKLLTNSQYQILSQHLNNLNAIGKNHLSIIIVDENNTINTKKIAEDLNIGKKDILLISLPKKEKLTAYLADEINTEFTSYTSNNILDRAMSYDGGNFSDFLTMIYLLIVRPDNVSFSTKKTHFDKLEHATLEYKYLLEHYELPLTKPIKEKLEEPKNWNYLYFGLLLILLLRLKKDYDRWKASLVVGGFSAFFSYGLDLGNPILVFLIFAIWSSFLKLKEEDLLGESKTTKMWEDRDEDQNTWGNDDD